MFTLNTLRSVNFQTALALPIGSVVVFERWSGSCYFTTYHAARMYEVCLTKKGARKFLKPMGFKTNSRLLGRGGVENSMDGMILSIPESSVAA